MTNENLCGPEKLNQVELDKIVLNLDTKNEGSGLLAVENGAVLEAHGWNLALWTVSNAGKIQDCVAAMGHKHEAGISEGWEIEPLKAELSSDSVKTKDTEAIARYNGRVYMFGSHFGGKRGPLEPERGFVARFREADVKHVTDGPPVGIEVFRETFVLHRLINDALKEYGPPTIPLAPKGRQQFIEETRSLGGDWENLIYPDDLPLNIEGAAFRPDGSLLLGLRFPVAESENGKYGRPMLVELEGIDRVFEPGNQRPEVRGFWVVDNAIGQGGFMAGVRGLTAVDDAFHLVTGNVDGRGEKSDLIEDYSRGHKVEATHFSCTLPPNTQPRPVEATFVRELTGLPRVEGIATIGNCFFYVVDHDECIPLLLTRLPGGCNASHNS